MRLYILLLLGSQSMSRFFTIFRQIIFINILVKTFHFSQKYNKALLKKKKKKTLTNVLNIFCIAVKYRSKVMLNFLILIIRIKNCV